MERKYKDGEFVLIGYPIPWLKVMIESAELCVKGWRYKVRYLRKDGNTVDKRKVRTLRFESEISPII